MRWAVPFGTMLIWPIVGYAANGDSASGTAGVSIAAETTVEARADDDTNADTKADASTTRGARAADTPSEPRDEGDDRWIHRWAPEPKMGEIGAFGGVYRPGPNHELFEPDLDLPDQGFKSYAPISGEMGARVGYYPLRFFGIEAEGGAMPTETDTGDRTTLWNLRGSVVGQLGKWSLTPFALVGAGMLGVSSRRSALGNDVDPSLHFGGGLKIYLNRSTQVRLDIRDVVGHERGLDNRFTNHSIEALLGVSLTLGRSEQAPPSPVDSDGDGYLDVRDRCVDEVGVAPDGCPIRDSDGDGFMDPNDACIDKVGIAPDGCPVFDTDSDGWLDPDDQCVDEVGVAPYGCPAFDSDGDGLSDEEDACKEEPETKNGFEDDDGCPDELPQALADFTGVIEGIRFQSNKAKILPRSRLRLDNAAKVMLQFPEVRLEISGHTDSTGSPKHNLDLSQRRAEAVKSYLVSKGVDASRMETRGAGQTQPIADNGNKRERGKNRRIEFKVITNGRHVATGAK